MNIEALPLGKKYYQPYESHIQTVVDSKDGFDVVISTKSIVDECVELCIHFDCVCSYRYLDEGDLMRYWESKAFTSPHHIFEILSGGWSNGEVQESGMMSVISVSSYREWFIVTANGCLNVLSVAEPCIKENVDA